MNVALNAVAGRRYFLTLFFTAVCGVAGCGGNGSTTTADENLDDETPEIAISDLGGMFSSDGNSQGEINSVSFSGQTEFSDASLERLAGTLMKLSQLQTMFLDDTSITDAGLVHLKPLKTLRTLDLRGTSVTEEGVDRLGQALPGCTIQH